ncbi:DUF2508 family protein [Syntrophomonas curvata]
MGIWSRLYSQFLAYRILGDDRPDKQDYSDKQLLKQAHLELMCAHNMFARMLDEDMVDCAIFSINAAEKRYNYLIKQIKQERYSRKNTTMIGQLGGNGVE